MEREVWNESAGLAVVGGNWWGCSEWSQELPERVSDDRRAARGHRASGLAGGFYCACSGGAETSDFPRNKPVLEGR